MKEFDLQLWKDRAWKKYGRALTSGRPQARLELEWAVDLLLISDLFVINEWCKNKGLKVLFGKTSNGNFFPQEKKILISSHASLQNQVIILLHECGHYLIGELEDHERFGMGYPQTDPGITKTFQHRLACLEEEFEAWHRGWKLSKRLNLRLNREDYDNYRIRCLRSYIKWSLKPGTFKEVENEQLNS